MEDIIKVTLACLGCSNKSIQYNRKFLKPVARSWTESSLFYRGTVHWKLPVCISEVKLGKYSFASKLLLMT